MNWRQAKSIDGNPERGSTTTMKGLCVGRAHLNRGSKFHSTERDSIFAVRPQSNVLRFVALAYRVKVCLSITFQRALAVCLLIRCAKA